MVSESAIDAASKYFSGDYNCAQAVFRAFLEHKDAYIEGGTQIASGFGGGITHSGQQCGALSGAIMAIGRMVGFETPNVKKHKSETYRISAELLSRFSEKHGTIICDELTGVNMSDKEVLKKAIDSGHFQEICPGFVKDTVSILMDLFPE
ncbi:MAG: C-GCAxxG-C-C family protein [Candidatus Hodarchaeota archaeon]